MWVATFILSSLLGITNGIALGFWLLTILAFIVMDTPVGVGSLLTLSIPLSINVLLTFGVLKFRVSAIYTNLDPDHSSIKAFAFYTLAGFGLMSFVALIWAFIISSPRLY